MAVILTFAGAPEMIWFCYDIFRFIIIIIKVADINGI